MTFSSSFITALDALCAQHGVARNISKGKMILIDAGGQEAEGKMQLRHYGAHYGLAEEDFGAAVVSRGKRFKLVGLNTNAPKYPLQMENQADGQVWRFPRSFVPQIVAQRKAANAVQVQQTSQAPTNHGGGSGAANQDSDDRYAGIAQF